VLNVIATSLFATSYILRTRASRVNKRPPLLSRLVSLTGAGLVSYTGWLGGKLVEEQGEAVKPIIRQQNEAEKREIARQRPKSPSATELNVSH
jgi:uncharacterized membrane protein